jgi:hypothetical protein
MNPFHSESENHFEKVDLETPAQVFIRDLVHKLPEESLSLSWRSSLNEKLIEANPVLKRRGQWLGVLRPALAFAIPIMLTVVLSMKTPIVSTSLEFKKADTLESALLETHKQVVASIDAGGVDSADFGAEPVSMGISPTQEDPDEDLDTL